MSDFSLKSVLLVHIKRLLPYAPQGPIDKKVSELKIGGRELVEANKLGQQGIVTLVNSLAHQVIQDLGVDWPDIFSEGRIA